MNRSEVLLFHCLSSSHLRLPFLLSLFSRDLLSTTQAHQLPQPLVFPPGIINKCLLVCYTRLTGTKAQPCWPQSVASSGSQHYSVQCKPAPELSLSCILSGSSKMSSPISRASPTQHTTKWQDTPQPTSLRKADLWESLSWSPFLLAWWKESSPRSTPCPPWCTMAG